MLQVGLLSLNTAVLRQHPHHVSQVFGGKSTNLGAFLRWGEHSIHTHSVYDPWGAYSKHVIYLEKFS